MCVATLPSSTFFLAHCLYSTRNESIRNSYCDTDIKKKTIFNGNELIRKCSSHPFAI